MRIVGVVLVIVSGIFLASMVTYRRARPPSDDVAYDILGLPVQESGIFLFSAHDWALTVGLLILAVGVSFIGGRR